jgi:hypothetical protein
MISGNINRRVVVDGFAKEEGNALSGVCHRVVSLY